MARRDVLVLGAGIVGVSTALQLARRGLAVTLLDRAAPGEQTSYGNAGVLEGSTVFPPAFPRGLGALLAVALKRSPGANYHLRALPRVAPWLVRFQGMSSVANMTRTALALRPLMGQAVAEHAALMEEAGALRYLRRTGWLKLYRDPKTFAELAPEFELASRLGIPFQAMTPDEAAGIEPSLRPVFDRAVLWPQVASISNPLAVTQAYAAHFVALGGRIVHGDAMSLRRTGTQWTAMSDEGALAADHAVVALGPWSGDLLRGFGIRLPFGYKRGYHRHFNPQGNASLARPVVDVDNGYLITPMEQGIRLTTGAEFARRDAAPTPVQFSRVMSHVRELFPLGERADERTWLGARPIFPDSRPVIGVAPGHAGLWLAVGHGHWGLTLGPVTGRLLGDLISGTTPFCDPEPYRAERFGQARAASAA